MVCDVCYFILAFRPRDDRRQNNGFVFYTTRILRNSAMPASVCLSVSVCLSRDVSMGGLTAGVFFPETRTRATRGRRPNKNTMPNMQVALPLAALALVVAAIMLAPADTSR